jgi:hypothetical protein
VRCFRTAPFAALVVLSFAFTLTHCGSSRQADDDDEDYSGGAAGEAGGGRGGGSGRGGSGGEAGDVGAGGEAGGSAGEAGGDATGGSGGKGNAGRGGTGGVGGAGGSAGRGGGAAGKGGAAGTNGGGAGGTGGDSGAATTAGASGNAPGGSAGSAGSGNGGIVTFLWGDYRESLVDATSYTFPQVSLAPAGATRLVVVAAHSATNVVASYTSLTIGGVAAQKVASVGEDVMPSAPTAFFVARIPTGDHADITMTLSAGVVRGAIAVCAFYGVESETPFDWGAATSMNGASIPLDVPAGGVVVAALGMADAASADAGWTSELFELYDTVMVEGTPTHVSGAMRPGGLAAGSLDVLVSTPSAGYVTRAVAVSFR